MDSATSLLRSGLDEVVARLRGAPSFGEFLDTCLEILDELVPSQSTLFSEVSFGDGSVRSLIRPVAAQAAIEDRFDVFVQHRDQNPLVQVYESSGSLEVARWQDVCDLDEYYESELHRLFYAPLGVLHQMVFSVPAPPDVAHVFVLNRATPFLDADVETCQRLRPFLSLIFGQRQRGAESIGSLLNVAGWSTFVVDINGKVIVGSGPLSAAFEDTLPVEVFTWFRNALPNPLMDHSVAPVDGVIAVSALDKNVEVRLVPDHAGHHVVMLRIDQPFTVEDDRLTPRQCQVLTELSRGGTNAEIAARLGIAVETVKKHLTASYRVLGVADRGSALAEITRRAG